MSFVQKQFKLLSILLVAAGLLLTGLAYANAQAIEEEEEMMQPVTEGSVTYPIEELGGCEDRVACREYCSQDENREACIDFATDHGFLGKNRAARIKEKLTVEVPGVCEGIECKEACRLDENKDACLEVAEQRNLQHKGWLQRAKAIREGIEGECSGAEECREYCSVEENFETCQAFAEENDLRSPEENTKLRRIHQLSEAFGVPANEMREYCSEEENKDRCIEFAQENDLVKPEMLRKVQAVRNAVKKACEDDADSEECTAIRMRVRDVASGLPTGKRQLMPADTDGDGEPDRPTLRDRTLDRIENDLPVPPPLQRRIDGENEGEDDVR